MITSNRCGGEDTSNRIYALYSSDLTPKWVFNVDLVHTVSSGYASCVVDYPRNTLYCATAQLHPSQNPTLWALDVITGALKWSGYVGSVYANPEMGYGGSRLYVASPGIIHAMNVDPGENCGGGLKLGNADECWNLQLGQYITHDIFVDSPPQGRTLIFAVEDFTSQLSEITDEGNIGKLQWSTELCGGDEGHCLAVTAPVFLRSRGLVYVGDEKGAVHQVDVSTIVNNRSDPDKWYEVWAHAGQPGVADVLLDRSGNAPPDSGPDRLMVQWWSGPVARYSIPWQRELENSTSNGTTTGGNATTVTSTMTDPTTSTTLTLNTTQLSTHTQQNSTAFTTTQTYTESSTVTGTATGGGSSTTTLITTVTGPITLTTTTTGESTLFTCILTSSCYTLTLTGNQTITITTDSSSTLLVTQTASSSTNATYTSTLQTFGTSTLTISNSTGIVYTSTITSPVTLTFASASTTTFTSTLGTNTRDLETFTVANTTSSTAPPQPGPGCIIATAAYGSELAPPVQFLRGFRDRQVQRTYLGTRFLSAFNAWYYSWAPSVARQEARNDILRGSVRVAILPLLGALFLAQQTFTGLATVNPEFAILVSGLIASSLIGAAYLTPIAYLGQRLSRRRFTRKTFLFAFIIGLVSALSATLGYGSTELAQIMTAILVIETILLVPLAITRKFPLQRN